MTWNYRVVRYKDGRGFGLHEVFYNKAGEVYAMTEKPTYFAIGPDDDPVDIAYELNLALDCVVNSEVFDEPEEWATQEGPVAQQDS